MFKISQLQCEFTDNPLGIDTLHPRFSWLLEHPERGQSQSAYQLLVASTLERLAADDADLWDSGKAATGVQPLIEYAGSPLTSRQRGYWKVRAWDAQDRPSPYSETAWFETSLFDPTDWRAEWIGFPAGLNSKALYFRSTFKLEKLIESARAYVCGLGWYELRLNGRKVGSRVLDPAQTDFSKRILYTTYDVGEHLHVGMNTVGAIVGSGWYGAPKLLVQVEIKFKDGTQMQVVTGRQGQGGHGWQISSGAIIENSVFDGEVYDARLEKAGWDVAVNGDTPFLDSTGWISAMLVDPPGGRLAAQMLEPIEVIDTLQPKTLSQPKPGVYVFDMGQNLAGWAALKVSGSRGTTITLRYAESLYEDGTVNQENLRTARARDVYILKGDGVESWEPRFTYHGFRYVQGEGFLGEPTPDAVQVRVVRTALATSGTFDSSHALVNQLHRAIFWTESSNLHGLPTDCPQRDERMGWLNDMAARSEELIYNFEVSRLLPKWLDDIADAQDPITGAISDTAPYRWGSRPADPVSICYLLIPWLLYQHYGDRRVLQHHYEGMRRWINYLTMRAPDHIVEYSYYGDWAPPLAQGITGSFGSSAIARNTPGTLISTAHYYYAVVLFERIAGVLGQTDDAGAYRQLAGQIYDSFNRHFWDETTGGYGSNNQACNAAALYMRLVPKEREARTLANLVSDVEAQNFHLTTGNLCTKYILEVLTEKGYGGLAFQLVTQTSYPSWGYMLLNGATTIWERWEIATGGGMNSHNHPMYGSVGAWLYRALAGIQHRAESVGFSHFFIHPIVPTGLTAADASLNTMRGQLVSAWEAAEIRFTLNVRIPVGSTAQITVPKLGDDECRLEESGKTLWEAGQACDTVPGIIDVREESKAFIVSIGSGSYYFAVECV